LSLAYSMASEAAGIIPGGIVSTTRSVVERRRPAT
jgi:hypothetical protein